MDPLVIDWDLGIQLAGSQQNAREMLDLLIDHIREEQGLMDQAFSQQNWRELSDIIHKFHGGVCYTGTPRLKMVAQDLETALKTNQTDRVKKNYSKLKEEIKLFINEYQEIDR